MLKSFLLRRLQHTLLLLTLVSMGSFLLLELAPGDFLTETTLNPRISPQTLASLRDRFGLTKSLPERYFYWVRSAAQGEFGISFAYDMPVRALIWPRMLSTLLLTATSLGLAWMIALPLGVWA
ncbi:MAG: ABC transporter permease, partial [Bryobacteraceae bacterium]